MLASQDLRLISRSTCDYDPSYEMCQSTCPQFELWFLSRSLILDSNWILSNRLHRIRLKRERSIVFHFNKVTFNLPSIAKRRPICENCRSVAVVQLERPMFGRRIDTQVLRMRSVLQMRLQAIRQWFGGVNCFQLKLSIRQIGQKMFERLQNTD